MFRILHPPRQKKHIEMRCTKKSPSFLPRPSQHSSSSHIQTFTLNPPTYISHITVSIHNNNPVHNRHIYIYMNTHNPIYIYILYYTVCKEPNPYRLRQPRERRMQIWGWESRWRTNSIYLSLYILYKHTRAISIKIPHVYIADQSLYLHLREVDIFPRVKAKICEEKKKDGKKDQFRICFQETRPN